MREQGSTPKMFKDTLLDTVPYEDMPEELLIHQEALGDDAAAAELGRRADARVDEFLRNLDAEGPGISEERMAELVRENIGAPPPSVPPTP